MRAAEDLSARFDAPVTPVVGDVTTARGREAPLEGCAEPDILVNNNAGPAMGSFMDLDDRSWREAVEANMIAPLSPVRAVAPAMRARKFGRIVNITSAMVTTPRPGLGLSSGARAGLTAALKGFCSEIAADNVTINSLLPERFDTGRQAEAVRRLMDARGLTLAEARARQIGSIPAGRMGRPEELGALCAFLCSEHAGYITGMNIRLDGGAYTALL